jgi:hypothetical protein
MTPEEAKASLPYPAYRAWWAEHIGWPIPKRRKAERVRPEPGVYDLADEDNG